MIELSDQDAEMFKKFREYQNHFEVLVQNRVFEVRKGQAILSFSPEGTITDVDIHFKAFVRKRNA